MKNYVEVSPGSPCVETCDRVQFRVCSSVVERSSDTREARGSFPLRRTNQQSISSMGEPALDKRQTADRNCYGLPVMKGSNR